VDANLAKGDGFLRAIKIRITSSLREELKPTAPCCKILWYVEDTCGM
jgi:hypothetical protein